MTIEPLPSELAPARTPAGHALAGVHPAGPGGAITHRELVDKVHELSARAGRDLLDGRDPRAVTLAELKQIVEAVRP